jgi:hypothetical protein
MKNVGLWDIGAQFVPHRKHVTSPLQPNPRGTAGSSPAGTVAGGDAYHSPPNQYPDGTIMEVHVHSPHTPLSRSVQLLRHRETAYYVEQAQTKMDADVCRRRGNSGSTLRLSALRKHRNTDLVQHFTQY